MRTLEEVASRLVWWESPEQALANKNRFVAQVMVFGDLEDTLCLLHNFSREELLATLKNPPYGVFTPASWRFWHIRFGLTPPPLPSRSEALRENESR